MNDNVAIHAEAAASIGSNTMSDFIADTTRSRAFSQPCMLGQAERPRRSSRVGGRFGRGDSPLGIVGRSKPPTFSSPESGTTGVAWTTFLRRVSQNIQVLRASV